MRRLQKDEAVWIESRYGGDQHPELVKIKKGIVRKVARDGAEVLFEDGEVIWKMASELRSHPRPERPPKAKESEPMKKETRIPPPPSEPPAATPLQEDASPVRELAKKALAGLEAQNINTEEFWSELGKQIRSQREAARQHLQELVAEKEAAVKEAEELLRETRAELAKAKLDLEKAEAAHARGESNKRI